ncbi:APC family permease [Kallotenue papyrolyticum]|uniref:APC family permease n=1 Tax=Kallotenue papyrolyticum TaxID=1325125 RepID=UPI0004786542|nr:APC family permease [Kallotenue papyrolyticum]
MLAEIKRVVIGSPLETARQSHERLNKRTALAVFSSDAMSSSAYATEEILRHLALAGLVGTAAFHYAMPIALLIGLLLVIVAFSYRQTIAAYPNGGGSYIVASDNLGRLPGLVAGAALLIDYVLTVAVSISAGVFALTSLFQDLTPYRVEIALLAITVITLANLRGVRESGAVFSVPTYLFLLSMLSMIGYGLLRWLLGDTIVITPPAGPVAGPGEVELVPGFHAEPVGLFLLMSSFASGCAALTSVEAISNGVPAFKKPEARNARITLVWMAGLLLTLFIGITWLSGFGAVPSNEESVVSQIGRGVFGNGSLLHGVLQFATAGILFVAANTAYADFPRLASLIARDRYLPRQFATLGDRLVFSNGIVLLAIFAGALMVIFDARTTNLIPLYAVGVFLSFTLSQSGMIVHWFRLRTRGWRQSALINGIGACTTFVVMWVIIVSKFLEGAWMVVLLIPLLVVLFISIHQHYVHAARQLSLEGLEPPPPLRNTVIVPISTLHRGTINALRYAESIAPGNVTAVHVSLDEEQTAKIRAKWAKWGGDTPLVVLHSPYRSLVRPLLRYLDEVQRRWDNDVITVVLPEFIPAKWWHHLLHNQTAFLLKSALLFRKNLIVASVPYQLER